MTQPDLSGLVLLGRYRLLDVVGHGRFGSVYLARDLRTNAVRAAKILHRAVATDGKFLQRFQREAEILRRLDSPYVVRLYDFGEQDGLSFIIMELVQGVTLARAIADREQIPSVEALAIARQVASALATTNRAEIVHRDLKPANVILSIDGLAKLADFGIARAIDSVSLTGSGFVGTAFYAAPEQANGDPVDVRADIYSLGVVLYEMLSGQLVFDGDTPLSVALKHLYEPVPPLQRLAPNVPEAVAALVYRCLEKRPEDRFQTPEELIAAIDRLRDELVPINEFDPEGIADAQAVAGWLNQHPETLSQRPQARAMVVRAPSPVATPVAVPVADPAAPFLVLRNGTILPVPSDFLVVTIGRRAPKSQVFPDVDLGTCEGAETVSRRHARLVRQNDRWFLQEDESRHGTYLNEERLEPGALVPVYDGDELRFGAIRTVFRADEWAGQA